tara:strand:+ start:399 stop:590 length:192 start_codon:yes stop_codon:yes gene_type:complete
MARVVVHKETSPEKVEAGETKFICRCGLSEKMPFCDGSHHKTKDEGDRLFVYDGDERREVSKP